MGARLDGSSLRIHSPAKINLHLQIDSQRSDGYHDIRSLFSLIDLSDELTVEAGAAPEGECAVEGPFDIPAEKNLIWQAYMAYRAATGLRSGVRVRVEKRIPQRAGLGGGSSNAAAMLRLLQQLSEEPLSPEELHEVAAMLGSDVPFFLSGPCALAEGRGERLVPVEVREDLKEYPILLVLPEHGISTSEAYRRLDLWYATRSEEEIRTTFSAEEILDMYRLHGPSEWRFYNSFTPVLAAEYPGYQRLFRQLQSSGALFAEISGSGSALFALFPDLRTAERASQDLCSRGNVVRKVKMLASCPEAVYNTL
jgi:4-diphosphocytidyl-2-C-methyl-D-erythritol kinase